jgi:uncharacterized protein with PIN domain
VIVVDTSALVAVLQREAGKDFAATDVVVALPPM